jgi:hypothetical protein
MAKKTSLISTGLSELEKAFQQAQALEKAEKFVKKPPQQLYEEGLMSKSAYQDALELESRKKKPPALPLDLVRAKPKTNEEIDKIAERIARQQSGEHVKLSERTGNPKDVENLAGRSLKESNRVKGTKYTLERTKEIRPTPIYEAELGDINMGLPGDQTASDFRLIDVNGRPIGSDQQGGSMYGEGKLDLEDPLFWASQKEVAQQFQDKVSALAKLYNTDKITAYHLAMGQDANNFAMHFADANLKAIMDSNPSPEAIAKFNDVVRQGPAHPVTGKKIPMPHFVGIEHPEQAYLQMMEDPNLRKWFNNRMKVDKYTTNIGLPNGKDIQYAITEPTLRDMEINMTGNSAGRMVPDAELTDTADHLTYGKGIQGVSLGKAPELSPFELSFPDADQYLRAVYRPSDVTGTMQKVFPHQVVDQQHIDQLGQYYKRLKDIRGFAKGGKVGALGKLLEEGMGAYNEAKQSTEAAKQLNRIAGADVSTKKDLLTINDFHAGMMDEIRRRAAETKKQMESFEYTYSPGDNIFTEWSAKNNRAPYKIVGKGMTSTKMLGRDELGNKIYAPRNPAYWVESVSDEGVERFQIPADAIKGKVDVDSYAKGGKVGKAVGILSELQKAYDEAKALETVKPKVIVPNKDLQELQNYILNSGGKEQSKRLERALDEVPNLMSMYKPNAIKHALLGDNAKAIATINPADFEKYAHAIKPEHAKTRTYFGDKPEPRYEDILKHAGVTSKQYLSLPEEVQSNLVSRYKETLPYNEMNHEEYIKHLASLPSFNDMPFLYLNKDEVGLPLMPEITGHEGRHRNRALAGKGEQKALVQIYPRGDLREGLPRRSNEEFLDALYKEMQYTDNMVQPEYRPQVEGEVKRSPILLPDMYAKGGKVDLEQEFKNVLMAPIPANARMLAKSIINPSNVDESSFTDEELAVQRQAYLNSVSRSQGKRAKELRELHNTKGEFNTNPEDMQMPEWMVKKVTPTIQYEDYPVKDKYKDYGVGNAPISASFDDKGYSMSTSIGRAKYYKDKDGNIHVIDSYDFPKGKNMEDYGTWSLPFKAAHAVGEKLSHKMPMNINLGKFASGGNVNLEQEYINADVIHMAGGGWNSPNAPKDPKYNGPEYELAKMSTLKKTAEILGKAGVKQLKKEWANPNGQMAIDILGNLGADVVGFPSDTVSDMSEIEPIESVARPWGIDPNNSYDKRMRVARKKMMEARDGTLPMMGSENIRKQLKDTGITSGTERPLTETMLALATPAIVSKAPKIMKGIEKIADMNLPAGLSIKDVSNANKTAEFRSSVAKSVNSHKMETMPGAQWASWLQANGSKSAKKEAEATGLYDWLKTQPKVTKYDIEEHIGENLPKTENKVLSGIKGFTEEEKGRYKELSNKAFELNRNINNIAGMEPNDVVEYARLTNKMGRQSLDSLEKSHDEMIKLIEADPVGYAPYSKELELYKARIDNFNPKDVITDENAVKYASRVEPGGKNYKETIVSLPKKGKLPEGYKVVESFDDEGKPFYHAETPNTVSGKWRDKAMAEEQLGQYARNSEKVYESGHYRGIDNPLLHMRTNERLTPEGRKALFMEELQSDWAQYGRDNGFQPKTVEDYYTTANEYATRAGEKSFSELGPTEQAMIQNMFENSSKVPLAPYVTDTNDWTALGLKHALKQAVDEGHDYLAWTTGTQQAKRYDLSKEVDQIQYHPETGDLHAYKQGEPRIIEKVRDENHLAELIGKDAADTLLNQKLNYSGFKTIEGDDLKMGGSGMEGYYDKIVPQTMNDVLKQIGSKERTKTINLESPTAQDISSVTANDGTVFATVNGNTRMYPNVEKFDEFVKQTNAPMEQHGIEITPELRELILNEGLPHFHDGGEVDARTPKYDKIKPIDLEMAFKLSKFKE